MKAVVLRETKKVEIIACQNGILLATGQRRWQYAVRTPVLATGFTSDRLTAQKWYDVLSGTLPTPVFNVLNHLEP